MQTELNSFNYYHRLGKFLPLGVFLFGIWYFCLRILGTDLSLIPGDLGDARFINYLLEYGYQSVSDPIVPFWQSTFMFPFKETIAISDNMLGTMPFYAFFRMLGISQETSYQLWWIVICALNFWSAYYVSKKLFHRWEIAIIVGWIFAFTLFNFGQLNYMQMTIRFMVPIVIYSIIRLIDTGSIKHFAILVFGIVYQYYCVIYTGLFLMYFSFAFIAIYAIGTKNYLFFKPLFSKPLILKTTAIVAIGGGLLFWLMYPYYQISHYFGTHSYEHIKPYLPQVRSFLFPPSNSVAWSFLQDPFRPTQEAWWLHINFVGFLPILGVLISPVLIFINRKRDAVPNYVLYSLIAFLFILLFMVQSDSGSSLYFIPHKFPGIGSMRVLNRFLHVALFFALIPMAYWLTLIPKKWCWIVIFLAIIDNSFTPAGGTLKSEIQQRRHLTTQLVKKKLTNSHKAFALLDSTTPSYPTQLDAMIVSLYVKRPTVNGYTSNCPGEFGPMFTAPNSENLHRWLSANQLDESEILIIER